MQGYTAIVFHLKKVGEKECSISNESQRAVASGILRKLTNISILKYAWKLHKVLSILSKLSKALQDRNVHIASAQESIASTLKLLYMTTDKNNSLIDEIKDGEFRSIKLHGNEDEFIEARKSLHINLQTELKDRLSGENEGVLEATKIVSFSFWPDKRNFMDFGDTSVVELITHFSIPLRNATVELEEIRNEWILLKCKIYDKNFELDNWKNLSWARINIMWSTELPNLLKLVDLILSISSSTAECERGFSAMKRIKSSERSLLKLKTLDDLMMIHMNSKDCSLFDPVPGIETWMTKKQRYIKKIDSANLDCKSSKRGGESDSEDESSESEFSSE